MIVSFLRWGSIIGFHKQLPPLLFHKTFPFFFFSPVFVFQDVRAFSGYVAMGMEVFPMPVSLVPWSGHEQFQRSPRSLFFVIPKCRMREIFFSFDQRFVAYGVPVFFSVR